MYLINALKSIGFNQQEAVIYITLCKHGSLTGYEAAKLSGISRSNAYAALSSLVDKGSAYTTEGTKSKYIAIPKDDLIHNVKRDFEKNIKIIDENLEFEQITEDPYITISEKKNVVNKIKNMILSAKERLYFSAENDILELFKKELTEVCSRNLKVVILSPTDLDIPQHTYYESTNKENIKLIVDTSEVISGTLQQCLYSKNFTLVQLIREAIIHEIQLICIKNRYS